MNKLEIIKQINPSELTAVDLSIEFENNPQGATAYKCSIGGQAAEMLFYEDAGRAGIFTGGDSDWTDASSAEDAVERFNNDEMVN